MDFDSDKWKTQYNKNLIDNPRNGMIVGLEETILKKGMDQETVRDFLGHPEETESGIDIYDLGASPFGVDYEQYFIKYDEQNKVIEFYIQRG